MNDGQQLCDKEFFFVARVLYAKWPAGRPSICSHPVTLDELLTASPQT